MEWTSTREPGKYTAANVFLPASLTMPPDPEELREYVLKHIADHYVDNVNEANYCGYSTHHSFKSFGWKCFYPN